MIRNRPSRRWLFVASANPAACSELNSDFPYSTGSIQLYMFRSWRLGPLFQIDTTVHWSFWLLMIWVMLSATAEMGLSGGISAALFLAAVFVCVYLHELGHAFAARHYGIRTIDITMLPIGGLARLERLPTVASQELWIALAGPAVNIVIASALGFGLYLRGELAELRGMDVLRHGFLEQLLIVNLGLAIFNMFPALPMDGGRVLRSLLQMQTNRLRATEIAARISRYLAFVMMIAGLVYNWIWIAIGLFVLLAGFQELLAVRMQTWREQGFDQASALDGRYTPRQGGWYWTFDVRSPSPARERDPRDASGRSLRNDGDVIDADEVRRLD